MKKLPHQKYEKMGAKESRTMIGRKVSDPVQLRKMSNRATIQDRERGRKMLASTIRTRNHVQAT